jgi:hypothetical protein
VIVISARALRQPGMRQCGDHGKHALIRVDEVIGKGNVERTHAWQNAFHRLARCYERRVTVIDAFFDLADAIITVRSLIRRSWTTHRWDERPDRRP